MEPISEDRFHELVDQAFDSLPEPHRSHVKNVAIVVTDEPSDEQRRELNLRCDQTLLGLYTGVPLPQRQGRLDLSPDIITLFSGPLQRQSDSEERLYSQIRHTLWHEVAHYFGLDHEAIHRLEAEQVD